MAYKFVQTNTLYLSGSGAIIGATSVTLSTLTDIYGNVLTMTDFGSAGFVTLEPDTTNEEAAIFTGITANANGTYTLTGVQSLLAKSPYSASSGLIRAHAGGTKIVVSDSAAFWATFANKNNDEVILGNWIFNVAPTSLSATPASTTALGNVKLSSAPSTSLGNPTITIASPAVVTLNAHGLIAGDSIQFTTTGALPTGLLPSTNYYVISAGLTANAFEVSATVGGAAINTSGSQNGTHTLLRTTPFAVGSDDPRIISNSYGVDTGSANAYAITLSSAPASYKTGQIYIFKATNSNTTTSTLAVNGLSAINIVNYDGSAIAANAILAGSTYVVQYDGTSFRLLTGQSATNLQVFTSSGTWTKPTGAKSVEVIAIGAGGGGGAGSGSGAQPGGGGGGGGGGISRATFPASMLGSTVSVTVGTSTPAGSNGTNSTFGSFLTAAGGGAGTPGGAAQSQGTGGTGGAGYYFGIAYNGTAGGSGGGNAAGNPGTNGTTFAPTGGGGGTSFNSSTGGAGGSVSGPYTRAGGASASAGTAAAANEPTGGTGGGGGTTGGVGGAGAAPGGGGGGGGAQASGVGGAGGTGGAGLIYVLTT